MSGHERNVVEEHEEQYVLACGCGWRSAASPSAAHVGRQWDQHRRAAGDGN